jgi:DNA-directed RNA polymerase specialized sigma24 family protein
VIDKPTKEQIAFMRDMAKHTAQLMDFAKPYIGRLSSADRDAFISESLMYAWQTREQYKPDKENAGLLKWWNGCLRFAAGTRLNWRCSTFDGQFHMVPGKKLGQELL